MTRSEHTLQEIMSQPDLWRAALDVFDELRDSFADFWAERAPDQVIVSGCGSTYYLALTAARLLRRSGVDAFACPASELLFCGDSICPAGKSHLLLTVSRSGTTSETVRAQQLFQERVGGAVITVTCDSGSPLARGGDFVIAVDAAQERSVAQTRSFSSMALVIQQMAASLAGADLEGGSALPAACRALLADQQALARSLAEDDSSEKFFFLGSDALYGIACEAMLKMKEMSLSYSEAYHTLEFRHGPMSLVGADSLVVGLITPAMAQHEIRVLDEMAALGAKTLRIGQASAEHQPDIALPADLPAWAAPILHLPALQLLAYYRALYNGCDPDQPQNLSAVVSLEDI